MLNNQGRPTQPGEAHGAQRETFTGNRALEIDEALIFDQGGFDRTGVDIDEPDAFADRLGGLARKNRPALPGLSEPQAVRHYVRLSRKNYSIDAGLFPLGSCTMKHNPRLNEKMARLPAAAEYGSTGCDNSASPAADDASSKVVFRPVAPSPYAST